MSCDFSISSQELLESLFGILEWLLESESLVSSLGINKWIVPNLTVLVDLSSEDWTLAFVFGNQLVKTRWLSKVVNLSTIKLVGGKGYGSLLVIYHCIDIADGEVYAPCELVLVIECEPPFNSLSDVWLEDACDLKL